MWENRRRSPIHITGYIRGLPEEDEANSSQHLGHFKISPYSKYCSSLSTLFFSFRASCVSWYWRFKNTYGRVFSGSLLRLHASTSCIFAQLRVKHLEPNCPRSARFVANCISCSTSYIIGEGSGHHANSGIGYVPGATLRGEAAELGSRSGENIDELNITAGSFLQCFILKDKYACSYAKARTCWPCVQGYLYILLYLFLCSRVCIAAWIFVIRVTSTAKNRIIRTTKKRECSKLDIS